MPSTRADRERGDEALESVRAAKAGDPQAVREILRALEAWLRGQSTMPRCYAVFCADSFDAFLENAKPWELVKHGNDPDASTDASDEFEARDQSKDSAVETLLALGARLPERRLRRIGTAACRAFQLTRHPAPVIKRRCVLAPGEESSLQDQTIQFTDHFNVSAEVQACAARKGDPTALQDLLYAVVVSLHEEKPIPSFSAFFCADALNQWLGDAEAWERIEKYVRRTGRGSRAPINDVRPLGRSFCRAFRLSRPKRLPRPGETPHDIGFCPTWVYKFERLLEHGVTWERAVKIVAGAYPSLSSRTLDEWARLMEIKTGTVGEGRLMANRLRLAARVRRETAQGRNLEEAYLEGARWLARRVFPSLRSRMERWAGRVLQDSEEGSVRPEEHLELARRIKAASEQGQPLPRISKKLSAKVLPEIRAAKADPFIPDPLIAKLVPAVRKAHTVAIEVVDEWPRWARVWSYLERRYSRQPLAS